MIKSIVLLCAAFVATQAISQTKTPIKDTTRKNIDSVLMEELKENLLDNIPTVSMDDNDMGDAASQNISSVLTAGRDAFFSAAAFSFSPARFRMRGYDNDFNATFMNGIPMDNLDNGFTPFGLWGGLNDVMRNRDLSIGIRYNTFSFGDIGSTTNIDSRASKQRKQTQVGYALSNRNYTHRLGFYHATGLNKKGWAFVMNFNFRGADEAYVPGTYYSSFSYFLGVDKKINSKHTVSLIAFGAPTENGRQGAAIQEPMDLTGSNYYNPSWGFQNGKKRNANIAKTHQPFIIFTHDFKLSNSSSLVTAIGYSFGERSTSGLDWYNAADPRPDYYRYLPSYQTDANLKAMVTNQWRTNPSVSQINWDGLIQSNQVSVETVRNVNGIAGNNVTGLRSHYILEDRVIGTNRFNINTVFNKRVSNVVEFMAGANYQYQANHYFKRVNDLLGGNFYVDLNQFAERDFANTPGANQNDLNRPNRLLSVGDQFGYNYNINITKAAGWAQTVLKFRKIDAFAAVELSNTNFHREGFNRNGLFPNNSFGKSVTYNFTNYAVKAGITYKIDGRNYLYASAAQLTRAPYFDNVFISPRTRDFVQNNISSETVQTVEAGYVLNSPRIKARLSGYATRFQDQMNVITFFHDEYRNFVNYALNGIDKLHYGGEFGAEVKVTSSVSVTAAAAVGRYYFDSRQNANITVDNSSVPLGNETIYAENFRVANTPQEAYSLGIAYRSPKFWFVNLTGNYFDYMWLDFNPVRRTSTAVDGVDKTSAAWGNILNQTRFSGQATLDFFGGYSYRVPRSWGLKRTTYIVFNLGVNNLLNNQKINTGGFEQLRFDFAGKDPNRFPPRLFYAYGINYFASINFRFQ